MTDKYDSLGDRMKMYEAPTTSRVIFKGQPIVARLDGKSFHTFTKGLSRPYDERLKNLMVAITKELVDRYGAKIGYHQSDEITLVWYIQSDSQQEYPFGGRVQKLESILASTASAFMNKNLADYLPEKVSAMPVFDCRVFAGSRPALGIIRGGGIGRHINQNGFLLIRDNNENFQTILY